jgi:hypothetical protein
VSSVAIAGFFSESRLRLLDSFMPYRNEGMSESASTKSWIAFSGGCQTSALRGN